MIPLIITGLLLAFLVVVAHEFGHLNEMTRRGVHPQIFLLGPYLGGRMYAAAFKWDRYPKTTFMVTPLFFLRGSVICYGKEKEKLQSLSYLDRVVVSCAGGIYNFILALIFLSCSVLFELDLALIIAVPAALAGLCCAILLYLMRVSISKYVMLPLGFLGLLITCISALFILYTGFDASGSALREGVSAVDLFSIKFLVGAFLSAMMGWLNMMPLAPLDGWHVFENTVNRWNLGERATKVVYLSTRVLHYLIVIPGFILIIQALFFS